MAYYDYSYPYPSAMYLPLDPWRTTLVPQHFPEHHYPFEKARRTVGNTLSMFSRAIGHHVESDAPIIFPQADVQETPQAYYLDIERPGVEDRSLAKLEWVSGRTLLVTARSRRPKAGEEQEPKEKTGVDSSGSDQDKDTNGSQSRGVEGKVKESSLESHTVYLTV